MTNEEIKKTRVALDLTWEEVAAELGCTFQSIYNIETGKSAVNGSKLKTRYIDLLVKKRYDSRPIKRKNARRSSN